MEGGVVDVSVAVSDSASAYSVATSGSGRKIDESPRPLGAWALGIGHGGEVTPVVGAARSGGGGGGGGGGTGPVSAPAGPMGPGRHSSSSACVAPTSSQRSEGGGDVAERRLGLFDLGAEALTQSSRCSGRGADRGPWIHAHP